mmetsp:Transcript_77528/g.122191  ORF Transcript_77528/g.122191 Transcript_77528/m.122191 type:complete len:346 (+) Transcript_77528:517-1554(+)
MSNAPRAPDSVHVKGDLFGCIVVDHMGDSADVQAPGRHIGRDHDVHGAAPETLQMLLALGLVQITVQGRSGGGPPIQLLVQEFGAIFAVGEDQNSIFRISLQDLGDEVGQLLFLLGLVHFLDQLRHCHRWASCTANNNHQEVVQVILRHLLHRIWKGGGEHHGLSIVLAWHLVRFHNLFDLLLKAQIQHSISLVQDQTIHLLQIDNPCAHKVVETSHGGHNQISTFGQFSQLRLGVLLTVDSETSVWGVVTKSQCVLVGLHTQLPCGCEDQGIRLARSLERLFKTAHRLVVFDHARQHRDQECCRLAAAGLCGAHHVPAFQANWNGISLHRRGRFEATLLHVGPE